MRKGIETEANFRLFPSSTASNGESGLLSSSMDQELPVGRNAVDSTHR